MSLFVGLQYVGDGPLFSLSSLFETKTGRVPYDRDGGAPGNKGKPVMANNPEQWYYNLDTPSFRMMCGYKWANLSPFFASLTDIDSLSSPTSPPIEVESNSLKSTERRKKNHVEDSEGTGQARKKHVYSIEPRQRPLPSRGPRMA